MWIVDDAAILHVDLDAFYASVEQLRRPELRGNPIAVGGGVVLAASYEARAYGVRSAMPLRRARELCPRLIVVDGSYSEYAALSDEVFDICREFTPLVEQISIDEAFLDVSGARRLFGTGAEIAGNLKQRVLDGTGLVVSIGVASTKFLAKVASRVAKPDGIRVVPIGSEEVFLWPLGVELIWGVGPVTQRKLHDLGIITIGQLAESRPGWLEHRIGRAASHQLTSLAHNDDPRRVVRRRRAGSVGAQAAMRLTRDPADQHRSLVRLADRVAGRLRKKERAGRTITLRVRLEDMQQITRSRTLRAPVSTAAALAAQAAVLLGGVDRELTRRGVTLLGISVSNLSVAPHVQLELPLASGSGDVLCAGSAQAESRLRLEQALDGLRGRFGKEAIGPCSIVLDGRRRVAPDEFGDLAIPVFERRDESDD